MNPDESPRSTKKCYAADTNAVAQADSATGTIAEIDELPFEIAGTEIKFRISFPARKAASRAACVLNPKAAATASPEWGGRAPGAA